MKKSLIAFGLSLVAFAGFTYASSTDEVDLSVEKVASAVTVEPGEIYYYDITVSNAGPADATNVTIYENLPLTQLDVLAYSPAPLDFDVSTGLWSIPLIPAGQTKTLRIFTQVKNFTPSDITHPRDAIIRNSAALTSLDQCDIDGTNNQGSEFTRIVFPTLECVEIKGKAKGLK